MQATREEIQTLCAIQQADFDIMHKTRELEELPQRKTILECRQKQASMNEKMSKLESLKKKITKKITSITDEDASLAKKEHGVQAAIEAAGTDYRHAESRTKELNGIFNRRNALKEELDQVQAENTKLQALFAQAEQALLEIKDTEASVTESFKSEGLKLKTEIAQAEKQKTDLLAQVSSELSQAYQSVSERLGSVVIGHLEGTRCGICRTEIDAGRIIELKGQAPLGTCPLCKRLLIVESGATAE